MTIKLVIGVAVATAMYAILLFVPAGTLHWWRAWVIVGIVFIGSIWSVVDLYQRDPAVLEERMKSPVQKGQPLADRVLVVLLLVSFFVAIIFAPLDVFRLHLMAKPPAVVSSLGLVLFLAGWLISQLALRENAFAAPAVRHLEEKNQTVIDTGVYSLVRHPLYTGGFLVMIGLPLWLESYAATLLACIPIAVIVVRSILEEQFLQRELEGYDAYVKRVRYRFIPHVW